MSPGAGNRLVAAYGLYYLDNRPLLVRAGEWRDCTVSPDRWPTVLKGLRDVGCNAIAVEAPPNWRVSTPGDGSPGEPDSSGSLAALRQAIHEAGLAVIVQPGATGTIDAGFVGALRGAVQDAGSEVPLLVTDPPARADSESPFGVSLGVLRRQESASGERPLAWWALGRQQSGRRRLLSLAAAIAHGVKAYSLDVEFAGGIERDALARLQAFLGANEEELTASIEAHDQIAWLDYRPRARLTSADRSVAGQSRADEQARAEALAGFLAVLLTCGYNPTPLDLERVTEETLADVPAAVFPSRGFIDLESYGKLVVFTLRGGSLVTLAAPPARQADGTPFRSTFLWPHAPARAATSQRTSLLGRLLRRARASTTPQGSPLDRPDGGTLPGDDVLAEFPDAEQPFVRYGTGYRQPKRHGGAVVLQSEILLRRHGRPVAYRAQVRDGTSTVIGSALGSAYVTPAYYTLPAAERLALRRFAVGLFDEVAPRQIVPDETLEVEVVARLSPDGGCLLFVLNRLGEQQGLLRFPAPEALNLSESLTGEVLYTAFGSQATVEADALRLRLHAEDVLVVRLG